MSAYTAVGALAGTVLFAGIGRLLLGSAAGARLLLPAIAGLVAGGAVGRALTPGARIAQPEGGPGGIGSDPAEHVDGVETPDSVNEPDASDHPNVVLVVADDETIEEVRRAMPHLNGRNDWVTFNNASYNVSLCCPSRATILSGQYSHHTGVEYLNGGDFHDETALPVWLHDAGYRTGLFGKYLNNWAGHGDHEGTTPRGWDEFHAFDMSAYYDYDLYENGEWNHYGHRPRDYSTDMLADQASDFIRDSASGDQPFFVMYTPYGPHYPSIPSPRDVGAFADTRMPHVPSFNERDVSDKPAWVQRLRIQDVGEIDDGRRDAWETTLSVDRALDQLLRTLRETGEQRDTVVIFTSDNGIAFGEHRFNTKKDPYEPSMHAPLFLRIPGVDGHDVGEPVGNVDIASTVADIANVTPELAQDGRSMLPLVYGHTEGARTGMLMHYAGGHSHADAEAGAHGVTGFWAYRTPHYKYVEYVTGERELYDLERDPYELRSRVDDPRYRDVVIELRRAMHAEMAREPQDPATLLTLEDVE